MHAPALGNYAPDDASLEGMGAKPHEKAAVESYLHSTGGFMMIGCPCIDPTTGLPPSCVGCGHAQPGASAGPGNPKYSRGHTPPHALASTLRYVRRGRWCHYDYCCDY